MTRRKRRSRFVSQKEAADAMRRDPSGDAYAALLEERGQGVRAPVSEVDHKPLPDLTRAMVVAAYQRDKSGKELAELLTLHGIGVPIDPNPPPRPDPFRPLVGLPSGSGKI